MPTRSRICTLAGLWFWLGMPFLSGRVALPQESEKPEQALVIMERSGGFAGIHDRFEIYQDGRVLRSDGLARTIPGHQLQALRRDLTGLNARTPSADNWSMWTCFDCLRYRIAIHTQEGKIVISLSETQMGQDDPASALARSIRNLVTGLKWD